MFRSIIAAAVLALSAGSSLAGGGHDLKPKHGGVVQEVKDITYELVARGDKLVLHLDDHGKPVATAGASGRATVLSGADKAEAELVPAGDNRMETKSSVKVAPGAKIVTIVNLPGKPAATVRFALK